MTKLKNPSSNGAADSELNRYHRGAERGAAPAAEGSSGVAQEIREG